jgi:hypothetical protein
MKIFFFFPTKAGKQNSVFNHDGITETLPSCLSHLKAGQNTWNKTFLTLDNRHWGTMTLRERKQMGGKYEGPLLTAWRVSRLTTEKENSTEPTASPTAESRSRLPAGHGDENLWGKESERNQEPQGMRAPGVHGAAPCVWRDVQWGRHGLNHFKRSHRARTRVCMSKQGWLQCWYSPITSVEPN